MPRTFYHFEELNRDMTGKIRRREVQQSLIDRLNAGTAADGENAEGTPEEPTEEQIQQGEQENGWSLEKAPEADGDDDAGRHRLEDN